MIMLTEFNSPIAVTLYPVFVMYVLLYYSTKTYAFKQKKTTLGLKKRIEAEAKTTTWRLRLWYLVNLFFRVCQQVGEVWQHITVENNLCLLIGPCHNVTHRSQSCCLQFEDKKVQSITTTGDQSLTCHLTLEQRLIFITTAKSHLNFHLLVAKKRHKKRNNSRINDHLDLLVASVCQIGQSPHCVY